MEMKKRHKIWLVLVFGSLALGCDTVLNTKQLISENDQDVLGEGTGSAMTKYDDGSYATVEEYEKGIIVGYQHRFREDGSYESCDHFRNGARQGVSWRYTPNGLPKEYAYFKNDTLSYIAFYDSSMNFTRYKGFPVIYMDPVQGFKMKSSGDVDFSMELVKPPGIDVELLFTEYVNGEKSTESRLSFTEGKNHFTVKLGSTNTDSCGLNYKHILPMKGGGTKLIETSFHFPVVK